MTDAAPPLPNFEDPPVVEVVLGVAFEPAHRLTNLDLAQVWNDLYRPIFPKVSEKPPYETPKESFPPRILRGEGELIASVGPPPVRLWLASLDDTELIQLQHNWFARNWKKVLNEGEYPRYEDHIRPAFEKDFERFTNYVEDMGLELEPVQCEVTYVNHIRVGGPWTTHSDMETLFRVVNTSAYHNTVLETVAFRSSSLITVELQPSPVGRLHVEIHPAFDSTGRPIVVLNLTARGAPANGSTNEAVLWFLDKGRESIVRTFVEITSKASHELWRRIE